MRMLDLFSGIGGFALAAEWVWKDELEIVGFCEIEDYAQKILKKNFPNVSIYEDITKLDGNKIKNIDLLTGGFPCQDISVAGKEQELKEKGRVFGQKCIASLAKYDLNTHSLKTYQCSFIEDLNVYSATLPRSGMMQNGKCLTARISEFHKTENECSLSDILETNPDPKYFLSWEKLTRTLASRSQQKPQLLEQ